MKNEKNRNPTPYIEKDYTMYKWGPYIKHDPNTNLKYL